MPRRRRDYSRRRPTKKPRLRVAILAEGEVTEPEYIAALAEHFGLAKGLVRVIRDTHNDPRGLVEAALELRKRNEHEAKHGRDTLVDSWWVLADCESETDTSHVNGIRMARNLAGERIMLAFDSPSIEFWFLLHFERTTRDFDTARNVIKALRRYVPNYSKAKQAMDWRAITSRTVTALDNAEGVRQYRETTGATRPVAGCAHLVREILKISGRTTQPK